MNLAWLGYCQNVGFIVMIAGFLMAWINVTTPWPLVFVGVLGYAGGSYFIPAEQHRADCENAVELMNDYRFGGVA